MIKVNKVPVQKPKIKKGVMWIVDEDYHKLSIYSEEDLSSLYKEVRIFKTEPASYIKSKSCYNQLFGYLKLNFIELKECKTFYDAIVKIYTTNHIYKSLNYSLHSGKVCQHLIDYKNALERCIWSRYEELPDIVYRGTHMSQEEFESLVCGEVYSVWGFTSTTKTMKKAFPADYLITIKLKKGMRNRCCLVKNGQFDEDELLISSNSYFKILEKGKTNPKDELVKDKGWKYYIDVEMIEFDFQVIPSVIDCGKHKNLIEKLKLFTIVGDEIEKISINKIN